jgi:hypothetical protein
MSDITTVTASNTQLSVRDDATEIVNGDDDIITVGLRTTLTVYGFSDTIQGSYDWLTLGSPGPINTVNGSDDIISIFDNSVLAVNGGGNTFTQANGLPPSMMPATRPTPSAGPIWPSPCSTASAAMRPLTPPILR